MQTDSKSVPFDEQTLNLQHLTLQNNSQPQDSHSSTLNQAKTAINPYKNKPYTQNYYDLLSKRTELPVWQMKEKIQALANSHQTIIIQGENGSGKTTQVPQFLLESLYNPESKKGICVTQSERVAVMSAARRVSEEMVVGLGEEVGYSVKFEDMVGSKTILRYVTDAVLLKEAMRDPELDSYGVIIVDEVHMRAYETDVVLGILKEVIKQRKDLKLVIMSGTSKNEDFQEYFDGAPIINVSSGQKLYPVEIYYTPEPESDYLEAAITTVLQVHLCEKPGDILVFLPGEEEINIACQRLDKQIATLGGSVVPLTVLPLYPSLPFSLQQRVFEPVPDRKCVISTSIAQSSISISNIVYVIDTGFCKEKSLNSKLLLETIQITPASKTVSIQRAARARATRPGKCFRLYTQKAYEDELLENSISEILRSNLIDVVLILKRMGIKVENFRFIDAPKPAIVNQALEILKGLGALDSQDEITEVGRLMAEFPVGPELAKMIVVSPEYKCSNEVLSMVAMLSGSSCFIKPSLADDIKKANEAKDRFIHMDGDHMTLLNVYNAFKENSNSSVSVSVSDEEWCRENFLNLESLKFADNVRSNLQKTMKEIGLEVVSTDPDSSEYSVNIQKALISGYFRQVAHLQKSGAYLTVKDAMTVFIHPSSVLDSKPQFCLYHEMVLTMKNYIRVITQVKGELLVEIAPEYFEPGQIKAVETKKELERIWNEMKQD